MAATASPSNCSSSEDSVKASPPASPMVAPLDMLSEAAWEEPRVAGHDDDGEAILVEEDPQPHEIAEDPAMRCRYPSKHCLRRRTVKKTGALHSMCAFHRAKANRNQRRLEKRKRMLKDQQRATKRSRQHNMQPHTSYRRQQHQPLSMLPKAAPISSPAAVGVTMTSMLVDASPRGVSFDFMTLEPFRAPVPLFKEDLEELQALVDMSVSVQHVDFCFV
jgi:hypothetical protein